MNVEKIEELYTVIEKAITLAQEVFGPVSENDFTERLYGMLNEVEDKKEEEI